MEINLPEQNVKQFWLKIKNNNNKTIIFEQFTDQFVRRLGLHKREELDHKALMKRGILQVLTGGKWQQHCPVAVALNGTTAVKITFAETIWISKLAKRDCFKNKREGPFHEKIPSLWVVGILSWSRPAVLQQQSQFLVLVLDSKDLDIHRLCQFSRCWKLTGGEEILVAGVCKVKIISPDSDFFFISKAVHKKSHSNNELISLNTHTHNLWQI